MNRAILNKNFLARIILIALLAVTFGHAVPASKKHNKINTAHVNSVQEQENSAQQDSQDNQKEKKQKRSLWAHFYHFRKDYVYPVNHLVNLCSLGTINGLDMARKRAGYDQLPGGMWCTKWWVGIVDAVAAQQPAEVIVRDDVIRQLGYIVLYLGMQASAKKFGNRLRAVTLDNLGFGMLDTSGLENNIGFRFVGHLILDKAARVAGKIVVDPLALAAYYTVKYKKKDWWGKKQATKSPASSKAHVSSAA